MRSKNSGRVKAEPMAAMPDPSEADVRLTEQSIAVLASMPEMEWRTSILRVMLRLQAQVDENTDITADTQEVLNRDVLARLERVAKYLEPAESFFRVLGAMGNGSLRMGRWILAAVEFVGRIAKPLLWTAALIAAAWAWWKTGTFTWPQ